MEDSLFNNIKKTFVPSLCGISCVCTTSAHAVPFRLGTGGRRCTGVALWLFDSALVECGGISCRVLKVFLVCLCEIMCAGKVFFCAHIEVVVVYVVEHRVYCCYRRNLDWAGREADILICVVRTVYGQLLVIFPINFVLLYSLLRYIHFHIHIKFHRRHCC